MAPDGEYHLRVGLRRQGRSVTSGRKLFLDTVPPRPVVRYVSPDSISPDGAGGANSATLRFAGPIAARAAARLPDRSSPAPAGGHAGDPSRRVDRALERSGDRAASGRLGVVPAGGASAGCGRERRAATGPAAPLRGARPSRPGGPIRRRPCGGARRRAGAEGHVRGRDGRPPVPVERPAPRLGGGSSTAARADPPRSRCRCASRRSGVAMLTVRVGQHRHTTPFAVQGRRHERVLVVLPDATWQARNRLETNGDGYPDLLPEDSAGEPAAAVRGQRPAARLRRRPVRRAAVPRP